MDENAPPPPRRWPGFVALILVVALVAGLALTDPPPMPSFAATKAAWKPSEAWLLDRQGDLLETMRVDFHARRLDWVPLAKVAPTLTETMIKAEDKRFRDHGGVDWWALGSAIRARLEGGRSRGASTLSMQVAAFLSPELARPGARSWRDKLRQMRAARSLESDWSKDEILEAYLNLAGFRGEAQGIGAGVLAAFGKSPEAVAPMDAAVLVAMLPQPNASADAIARRACRVAPQIACSQLRQLALDVAGRTAAAEAPLGLAPHLAARLLKKPGIRLRTTIDRQTQIAANIALRRQLLGLGRERARDGAVVVVDNANGEILAYVGGVGGDSTSAFVDGANAPRQAGSTLKPFLYGQVIEKGYLTPASILDDSPVQLDTASGLYVPQNYDRSFKGPVSVRTALAGSLNVPAVRSLMLAGTEAFRDRLWDTGYRGLTEDGDYYGFSLALGSAEVTLVEQAAAYRSLAMGGMWSPLRLVPGPTTEAPRRVLSADAAWIISDILADPQARAGTFGLDSALKLPFWSAAKTGTSKAMRDNWCIGFSDRYTVAVWMGNLEGDSMKAVSGTSGAAPVWRDVMLALHHSQPGKAPPMPAGVEARRVNFTGGIEAPRTDYFIAGTGDGQITLAGEVARKPRIISPVSGAIYALDPDIPLPRQKLGVRLSGALAGHRLLLDKRDIGAADAPPMLAAPPGAHRLMLIDGTGRVVDQILFTVR